MTLGDGAAGGRVPARSGRSAVSPRVVGVDLGGTKTAAALVAPDGTLGTIATVPTPASAGPEAILDAVAEAVRRALGSPGPAGEGAGTDRTVGVGVTDGGDGTAHGDPQALDALGVGTAGAVDAARGVIVSSTDTLAGWLGTDLVARLRSRLDRAGSGRGDGFGAPAARPLPVEVRNDVDAHALGEAWLGAAAGARSAFVVAAGTGIGGALLLDGALRTGAHHHAGEIGHVPTPGAEGLRCPCGRDGHLEALSAGPAIVRRYRALRDGSGRAEGTLDATDDAGVEVTDSRAVFAAADAGDELAARVIADAAAGLGRAVAGIVTAIDPDVVVVGGGLPQAGPRWWRPFEDALRAELVPALAGLPVVPATLGPEAAILGAARAAYESLEAGGAPTPQDRTHPDSSTNRENR